MKGLDVIIFELSSQLGGRHAGSMSHHSFCFFFSCCHPRKLLCIHFCLHSRGHI